MKTYHVKDRDVLTVELDWPVGLITGKPDAHGGLAIEHVHVLQSAPPHSLLLMMRAGLEEAWKSYRYLTFHLPREFPPAKKLRRLAATLGFIQYATDEACDHFILYRP